MTIPAHRRHDISDHVCAILENSLPGRKGQWGREAKDNRQFINAVFWILRTGSPWRDLPPDYGDWKIHIVDFAGGVISLFGKSYWSNSLLNLILNG